MANEMNGYEPVATNNRRMLAIGLLTLAVIAVVILYPFWPALAEWLRPEHARFP